jgi:hypothetical protein
MSKCPYYKTENTPTTYSWCGCNGDSPSGWIDVREELPEYTVHAGGVPFVNVLICANGIVMEGMYENGKWRGLYVDLTEHVTHWQPLPSPPEVKDE